MFNIFLKSIRGFLPAIILILPIHQLRAEDVPPPESAPQVPPIEEQVALPPAGEKVAEEAVPPVAEGTEAEAPASQPTTTSTTNGPQVVVRRAEIRGQVFIASEKPGEQEYPAENIRVEVRDSVTNSILRQTVTDKEGFYTLNPLDDGQYHLYIGGLRLNLKVEPEAVPAGELPKILIAVIPKDMARMRPEDD